MHVYAHEEENLVVKRALNRLISMLHLGFELLIKAHPGFGHFYSTFLEPWPINPAFLQRSGAEPFRQLW